MRLLGIGVAHQQGLDISVRGTVEGLEIAAGCCLGTISISVGIAAVRHSLIVRARVRGSRGHTPSTSGHAVLRPRPSSLPALSSCQGTCCSVHTEMEENLPAARLARGYPDSVWNCQEGASSRVEETAEGPNERARVRGGERGARRLYLHGAASLPQAALRAKASARGHHACTHAAACGGALCADACRWSRL